MSVQCGHCGATLDTRTSAAADHVMQHEPKGSRAERRHKEQERKIRRVERAHKAYLESL